MDSACIDVQKTYRQRRDESAEAEEWYARRDRALAHLRTVTFLAAVAMFGLGWISEQGTLWHVAGGVGVAGFLALITYNEHVVRQRERNGILRRINEEAIARLRRDWDALPETSVEVPEEHRATTTDLELFGHASLFHFLCPANTPAGIRVLRDWLLEPASPDEIRLRQQAVEELAPHLVLRETLALEGRLLADRGNATDRFLRWAEGDPWLRARSWRGWVWRVRVPGVA